MSNNKQNSVEWLDRWFRDNPEATHEEGNVALTQAKAMHKQEMIDFAMKFMMQDRPIISFYNETFGGNNEQ
jgi:hypothetical protein